MCVFSLYYCGWAAGEGEGAKRLAGDGLAVVCAACPPDCFSCPCCCSATAGWRFKATCNGSRIANQILATIRPITIV